MKDLFIAYFLCAAGLFTPLAGLHRFYINRSVSGFFYLITWGFFGIGTVIDLIRMPVLVDNENMRLFFYKQSDQMFARSRFTSPERSVLKCAHAHDGVVTVQMVALSSGLSMAEARVELERLYSEHFCTKDVDEDGTEIYQFKGLKAKKPLSLHREH